MQCHWKHITITSPAKKNSHALQNTRRRWKRKADREVENLDRRVKRKRRKVMKEEKRQVKARERGDP